MSGDPILSARDREVINLGVSLAAGCQPCLKYHLRKCTDIGISEKEIHEILSLAEDLYVRAYEIMKLRALAHVDAIPYKKYGSHSGCNSREEILVGLAVSYTVNCMDLVDLYLACARKLNMSDSEIVGIINLSKFTRDKARAHVELIIEGRGVEKPEAGLLGRDCGCGC